MPTEVPPFARRFFGAAQPFTRIGDGELGGKGSGLLRARDLLERHFDSGRAPSIRVDIPTLTVLTTSVFDRFLSVNHLDDILGDPGRDDRLALAFQRADLPPEILGDLRSLVEQVRTPLAVRSSSLLEDALYQPFAGVYATKMIPNHQPDADSRFRRLAEAIKFVYASTFFRGARAYRATTGRPDAAEKMAVLIQEVVGRRHNDRFYPDVSGVGRSWNYYPTGRIRPEDGVVNLALGLGKTIVDGGLVWSYSPALPRIGPPAGSVRNLIRQTQSAFWAVNMGPAPPYDPTTETEYLTIGSLADAEYDGTLQMIASTYDPHADRLTPGTGRAGPRVVTFAPLLDLVLLPLNQVVRALLDACEEALGGAVEIEFAMTTDRSGDELAARLGFLQVRPMAVPGEAISVSDDDLASPRALVASDRVMGNGRLDDLRDVVYVRPDAFDPAESRTVARELTAVNARLLHAGRHYLLIGFGRWGSADPWLGIPVEWDNISQARAIVETQTERLLAEPSQGSHFFHNLSSFAVLYFTVPYAGPYAGRARVDWEWLLGQPAAGESPFVRHVTLPAPLSIRVDGRTGRGVVIEP
jgi:hypothetical protein